jgi:hypothetical protein
MMRIPNPKIPGARRVLSALFADSAARAPSNGGALKSYLLLAIRYQPFPYAHGGTERLVQLY